MTTDPNITIAGLRAQIDSLETSLRGALDDAAAGEEVRLINEAAHAAVAAERAAVADLLSSVRAALARREADDLSRDATEPVSADAATAQLAAARQVIDEERATVARMTARVAELEARPVLTAQWLTDRLAHLGYSRTHAEMDAQMILGILAAPLMPAQDRAEELGDAYVDAWNGLGVPTTTPTAAPDRRLESTPTAAPGLVAAVSVEELIGVYGSAYNECSCSDGRFDDPSCCNKAAIRAVLARLNATTIAPVDPEAVARAYHDHKDAPAPEWDEVSVWRGRDADEKPYAIAAMRATLTAHGIPVTPEGGK